MASLEPAARHQLPKRRVVSEARMRRGQGRRAEAAREAFAGKNSDRDLVPSSVAVQKGLKGRNYDRRKGNAVEVAQSPQGTRGACRHRQRLRGGPESPAGGARVIGGNPEKVVLKLIPSRA